MDLGEKIEGRQIAVISHADDLDGIASAALIKIRFGVPLSNLFFTNYSKRTVQSIADMIKKIDVKYLFITDTGPNEQTTPIFKNIIAGLKKKGAAVIWLDHHEWNAHELEVLARKCDIAIVGENKKACATEIVRSFLGLSKPFETELAKITHFSDFNIMPKNKRYARIIKNYALGIAYFNMTHRFPEQNRNLVELVKLVSEGKIENEMIKRSARTFEKLNKARVKKMISSLHVGNGFAIGFSRTVQATYACGEIIRKSGMDIGMFVDTDTGKVHMRSVNGNVACIAKLFGGGGHPHAAGFSLSEKLQGRLDKKAREMLIEKIEDAITKCAQ